MDRPSMDWIRDNALAWVAYADHLEEKVARLERACAAGRSLVMTPEMAEIYKKHKERNTMRSNLELREVTISALTAAMQDTLDELADIVDMLETSDVLSTGQADELREEIRKARQETGDDQVS